MAVIFVAGATGALGRALIPALHARGHRVLGLTRRAGGLGHLPGCEEVLGDALGDAPLAPLMAGCDVVISVLGASVAPTLGGGRAGYDRVDTPANLRLIEAAGSAGVGRFVYVAVGCHEALGHLTYVSAHEAVVLALRRSPLPYSVLRPTGFFSAFEALLPMAKRGSVPLIGDPEVRTNPIADGDLAALIAEEAEATGRREASVGGPEILSRGQICALACQAVGRPPRIRRVPAGLVHGIGTLLAFIHPRLGQILRFYAAVGQQDCLGALAGEARIGAHFQALAGSE